MYSDGNVFHIYSNGRKPIILKTQSSFEREQWIQQISDATGSLYVADWGDIRHGESTDSESLNRAISLANEHFGSALDPRMTELAGVGTGLIPAPGYPPVPGVMQSSQIISSE